jgi:hypothetical protein
MDFNYTFIASVMTAAQHAPNATLTTTNASGDIPGKAVAGRTRPVSDASHVRVKN